MKYVYLIEPDAAIRDKLYNTITSINPELKIRYFDRLDNFVNWLPLMMKDGPKALHAGGFQFEKDPDKTINAEAEAELLMIMSDNFSFGVQHLSLLRKAAQMFLDKRLCKPEEPTRIVLTCFDEPDFKVESALDPIITNLIFKPFDDLILRQHLIFALDGRKKASEYILHNMKTNARVEMLKDVELVGISMAGLTTKVDLKVETGKVSKYYFPKATQIPVRNVYARSVSVGADGLGLSYFGLDLDSLRTLRTYLPPEKDVEESSQKGRMVVFEEDINGGLAASLRRRFPKAEVYSYQRWEDYEFEAEPSSSKELTGNAFTVPDPVQMRIDLRGQMLMDFLPKLPDQKLCGTNIDDFKRENLSSLIHPLSRLTWKELIASTSDKPVTRLVIIDFKGKKHVVKMVKDPNLVQGSNGKLILMSWSDPTAQEKALFLKSLSTVPKSLDIVFGNENFLNHLLGKQLLESSKKILLTKKGMNDADIEAWAAKKITDIFYEPLDRAYCLLKVELFLSQQPDVSKFTSNREKKANVKVSRAVELIEISEAGLVMKHHRPLKTGTFRKFFLHSANPEEFLEYIGTVNFVETVKEEKGESHTHHFVFFGVRDAYLKNIRLWIRENYIQNKEKSA